MLENTQHMIEFDEGMADYTIKTLSAVLSMNTAPRPWWLNAFMFGSAWSLKRLNSVHTSLLNMRAAHGYKQRSEVQEQGLQLTAWDVERLAE